MPRKADIPADLFLDRAAGEEDGQAKRDNGEPLSRQKSVGPASYTKVRSSRIGRPPVLEGPKEPVTLYLTEPAAHRLEEARYLLRTEHGLKTTKSALADYALRHGLQDLATVAAELGREQGE